MSTRSLAAPLARQAPDVARILVVDDDPRNLLAVEEVLRELGHVTVLAKSGEDALRALLADEFAVILLDVQMPGMDGYETATMIRSRDKTRHVPIIFLTAVNKDEAHIFRGYAAGAVDYIFKPFEPEILKSKVAVFVDLWVKTREIERKAEREKRLMRENFRVRAEKMKADQELRRSEQQQALIIGTLPVALYTENTTRRPGGRRFVSENVERITGFKPDRFVEDGELWRSRLDPADRERVLDTLAAVRRDGVATLEYRWQRADGEMRWFLDQAVLVGTDDGHAEVVGTWLDVTERKNLEQQLLHAQKMEAIGQLTGGIAHDFNNMLSIVIGNIELLKNHVNDEAGGRRAKLALDGALRCANMTQRLLTFARRQPLQQKTIDLNEFVGSTCDLLRRMLPENVEISFAPTDELWPIRSDPTQVEAAIVNLAVNARDAMEAGGRIAIALKNVPWSEFPDSPAELEPADFVMIEVADSGSGIPPEVLARVFEPFFTTKEIGKGTGLGLATTYGFVKQSGGHVAIDSAVGEGTRVRLFLPRDRRSAPPREPAPLDEESGPATGETILVVEDEAAVREVAVSALSRLGYNVLEASSAEHGLELLEREPNVRLLFTDILMPGRMGGRELAREALRRRPGLKVLYASGYGGADAADHDADATMRKPYLGQELAGRVRALLARDASAFHAGAA